MQRLPQLQHHIVGDVHGQRDGTHPAQVESAAHPQRCGRGRVESGDTAQHVAGADRRVGDTRGIAALGSGRQRADRRVSELHTVGSGHFPGDTAQGQRIAPVRGDRDVQHRLTQPQQVVGLRAGLGEPFRQHDDALVVLPQAQFARRADHALRHAAVGFPGRDRETAGQDRAGQRHHDQVAFGEVAGTADDACGSPVPLASPTSTVQNRMGFLNPVSSSMVSTRPTTMGPLMSAPTSSTVSTSRPRLISLSASSRAVARQAVRRIRAAGNGNPHHISIPKPR